MTDINNDRYEQLKASILFLSAMLEEGSLVARYQKETREEIGDVLRLLIEKVDGLPSGVPQQLVEATAVRAIIDASEKYRQSEDDIKSQKIEKRMREAEMAARLKGLELSQWEQIGQWEFQSSAKEGEGFVYVTPDSTFDLLGINEEIMFE